VIMTIASKVLLRRLSNPRWLHRLLMWCHSLVGLIEHRGMNLGFLSADLDGISGPLTMERVE
jgi:hypothetical protein